LKLAELGCYFKSRDDNGGALLLRLSIYRISPAKRYFPKFLTDKNLLILGPFNHKDIRRVRTFLTLKRWRY